ncbi:MAG: hypothetical protein CV082_10345 [Candidatus Brocadia sp. BL1]|nr:MAG: hypothetical protein CV082_10345 [Candidatus Brocadia sp. BL1]
MWKEKVVGLTWKILNSIREYQIFCIPHIIKIIMQEDTTKREKKGYRVPFIACILPEKVLTNAERIENCIIRGINSVLFH